MRQALHLLLVSEDQGNAPALSLATTTLAKGNNVTWICSTRTSQELAELEALTALKNSHMTALNLLVVTREESQPFEVLTGALDKQRITRCAELLFDAASVTQAAIAGSDARQKEIAAWVSDVLDGVTPDLLPIRGQTSGLTPASPALLTTPNSVAVTVILQGRERQFAMPRTTGTLLEGAEDAGLDLPFSCRGGVCSSCRAKLTQGDVELRENYALDDWELAEGFTLPCQAEPISDKITLNYDEV